MKQNLKWKIPHTVSERWISCFSSYKNCKLKVKLWWVRAQERKKRAFFIPFILFTVYVLLYVLFPNPQQRLKHLETQNIWHCALTLLIRKTLDLWSIMFLVFLVCKHELLFQKWGNLVLYRIWSSFHFILSLQPHNSRYKIWNY